MRHARPAGSVRVARGLALACWVALALAVVLAGCDAGATAQSSATAPASGALPTATATHPPAATATAQVVLSFTCAPGGFPISASAVQASCQVSEQDGARVTTAKFTGATYLDEAKLAAAGWQHMDGAHGDGVVTSMGQDIYVDQNAWLVSSWTASSDGTSSISVEVSIPDGGTTPITCGKRIVAGAASKNGVFLPADSFTPGQSTYLLTPACETDLQQWYTANLATAGWTIYQSFAPPPGSAGAIGTIMQAGISQGSVSLYLRLRGIDESFCEIVLMPAM